MPVRRVLLFVYAVCGALAGLGGVVEASRLRSGVATLGHGEELNVIAAVVVGGTSLAGGQGKILGTPARKPRTSFGVRRAGDRGYPGNVG